MSGSVTQDLACGEVVFKEQLCHGRPIQIRCVDIGGQMFHVSSGPLRIASLEDDWYEDVSDPEAVIAALRADRSLRPDLFTFWQRLPDVEPRYDYPLEWEEIAALPISSYEHWWKSQIKPRIRTTIRKAERAGLVVEEVPYDDDFVAGMTAIFNESPVRQGRRFWHYGKDFETVKDQFSRYVHRESMIAAFFEGQMVGLIMLGEAGEFALLGQILSSVNHRDKAPNNALIAKAVEVSAKRGFGHLVYWYWADDSLTEFKRRCGFEKIAVPRYYVPLTRKGALALKLGAHHGVAGMIPPGLMQSLKRFRNAWHTATATRG